MKDMADKTMAALVAVLEQEGIEVCQHDEGDGQEYGELPYVVFEGEDGEADRAVELAWANGYSPGVLIGDWVITRQGYSDAHWTLRFD